MTNDSSLISCKDYLKNSTINTNLTIIDQIETPKMSLTYRNNFYFTSQWNLLKPFVIKKGYVPLLRRFSASNAYVSNKNDSISPDYFCLSNRNVVTNESFVFNISSFKYSYGNKIYTNFLIDFVFINQNESTLSNYTFNYSYSLFGSFLVNINTLFSGNILTDVKFINVQRIQTYPFRSIQINQFYLNCSLNNLRLDCFLKLNFSNYANSFQQITIDYGDGISFDSFRINPYCIYKDEYFYTLN